jgi:hypothetical protein
MKESNNNEEISIKIQTLDNTYSFKINQSSTILQLKEEISKKYNIPIDKQRLIFQGKFLKENDKLSFYKISEGCVIQLIAKSLEEKNNSNHSETNNQNNNGRFNEIYPIIQIPFRTNRRRRRIAMPHFDIGEYLEGFYQNLISLDNFEKCKTVFNANKRTIEAFDFSKSTYEVGEWVDVKDTINQWLEAQVIKVQNNKAYVHYNGWGTRWDEWIEFNSPRMRNFKTYTLQTPLAFSESPYPAIPCDSNMEAQQRPIDFFYYIEKTKNHLEHLLNEMNRLIRLRKRNTPLFQDDKFSKDNYEILFRATQMIPFLDRVGRMLSDISSVFSHFIVNPNYYTSFIFGYKRQDLFNEINKIKSVKNKDIFEDKIESNNNTSLNKDTQTPPMENKFLKKMQAQSLKITDKKETEESNNIRNSNSKIDEDKKDIKNSLTFNNNSQAEDNKIEKDNNNIKIDSEKAKNEDKNNINSNEESHTLYHRHNSYTAPLSEEENNLNSANFQVYRQRITQEEILPNQIATNLGYDLSFSSVELPFIQRVIYSYTASDRIISPLSLFYQIFSNKRLFPRVNLQIPTILPPGEVIMMTGYSPFPESNFDIYIHTISGNPNNRNENEENNNNNTNNNNNEISQGNNNTNINNSNNNNQNNINDNKNQEDKK